MNPAVERDADPGLDPPPVAPREPELEDCCGTGCVMCVFDAYQIALENYQAALLAWRARHPDRPA